MEEEGVSDSVPLPPPLMSSTTGPEKTDRKGDRSADIWKGMGTFVCICSYATERAACRVCRCVGLAFDYRCLSCPITCAVAMIVLWNKKLH